MANAKNQVVAGDYEGQPIRMSFGSINLGGGLSFNPITLDKNKIESYEVIDESKRKSAASAVGRAFVGSVILGPVGLLAGLSAKSKGIHLVAIQFKDGKKSLLEIDQKIYAALIKKLF